MLVKSSQLIRQFMQTVPQNAVVVFKIQMLVFYVSITDVNIFQIYK